jgi:ring-1,2-phenylacetyl-CoA epoxidase subunit PaaD
MNVDLLGDGSGHAHTLHDRTLGDRIRAAMATVDDPEYPGISIVDLGLLESIDVRPDGDVAIGLVPTFSGCPALTMIADDVRAAVAAVDGVAGSRVDVRWLTGPAWTVERLTAEARRTMATEFTVAVRIGHGPVPCPRCGGDTVEESMFGPSRCRAVHVCRSCTEVVEVMRA